MGVGEERLKQGISEEAVAVILVRYDVAQTRRKGDGLEREPEVRTWYKIRCREEIPGFWLSLRIRFSCKSQKTPNYSGLTKKEESLSGERHLGIDSPRLLGSSAIFRELGSFYLFRHPITLVLSSGSKMAAGAPAITPVFQSI